MARDAIDYSVVQLQRLLDNRRSLLERLVKKREQVRRELDRIERRIAEVEGTAPVPTVRRPRRPSARSQNERSLRSIVTELLTKNKKGYPLQPLQEKVIESGYKTTSKNFKNVLYQCLYNCEDFVHDPGSGCYKLSDAAREGLNGDRN